MAKIRFWKWQHTDELGLPSVTRFPISDLNRETAGHPEQDAWPLQAGNTKNSPAEPAPGVRPK